MEGKADTEVGGEGGGWERKRPHKREWARVHSHEVFEATAFDYT